MKKTIGILFFILLMLGSCSSVPENTTQDNTISRGTGENLGTVTARAAITEDRNTGEITGDTNNYGYLVNSASSKSQAAEKINAAVSTAMEKARAMAMYEIIQQVREKDGDCVANLAANTHRDYDPKTGIEVVTVVITADAIKSTK
ncbi:MAG: hypothetical protein LBH44_01615 [Treponema sp.]|jgi:hypothetical protein|nr:hypothetical protein [Treponema sp.]